ncbi:hypothetical protein HDU76_009261, partial [Blyttiomyces sp. JEL0837]
NSAGSSDGNNNPPSHLTYYGGNVIESVQVVPVYIGDVPDSAKYDEFYATLVNSPYMDWLSEYNTDTQSIGRGSFIESIPVQVDTPSKIITYDDVKDIRPYVYQLIQKGIIAPTTETYIPLHFGPGYAFQSGSDKSCDQFCGYHSSIDISDLGINGVSSVRYAVLPDHGSNGCEKFCGKLSQFENTCVTASHEIIETVTNPWDGDNKSWYEDFDQKEIGDLCQYEYGSLKGSGSVKKFTVQKMWSNDRNSCYAPSA